MADGKNNTDRIPEFAAKLWQGPEERVLYEMLEEDISYDAARRSGITQEQLERPTSLVKFHEQKREREADDIIDGPPAFTPYPITQERLTSPRGLTGFNIVFEALDTLKEGESPKSFAKKLHEIQQLPYNDPKYIDIPDQHLARYWATTPDREYQQAYEDLRASTDFGPLVPSEETQEEVQKEQALSAARKNPRMLRLLAQDEDLQRRLNISKEEMYSLFPELLGDKPPSLLPEEMARGGAVAPGVPGAKPVQVDIAAARGEVLTAEDLKKFRESVNRADENLLPVFWNQMKQVPGYGASGIKPMLKTVLSDTRDLFFLHEGMKAFDFLKDMGKETGADAAIKNVRDTYGDFLKGFIKNPSLYRTGEGLASQVQKVRRGLMNWTNNPEGDLLSKEEKDNMNWAQGVFGAVPDRLRNIAKLYQTHGNRGRHSSLIHKQMDRVWEWHQDMGKDDSEIFNMMTGRRTPFPSMTKYPTTPENVPA